MNDLFGTDIRGLVLGAFEDQLHAVTLHKVTHTIGQYGDPVASTVDHAGEGVRTKWKSETMVARGYALGTVKIILLQDGIVAPTKTDELTILGERFRIVDIEQDPVGATWSIAAVKV